MNTKESIEFLKNMKLWNLGDNSPIGKIEYEKQIDKLIELLEKHEQMWKEFKRKYGYYLVGTEKKDGNWRIENFAKMIEDKYFPKGGK